MTIVWTDMPRWRIISLHKNGGENQVATSGIKNKRDYISAETVAETLAEYASAPRNKAPARQVILEGDCVDVLRRLPDECVDLIVTSPPYADRRKTSYGGIHPDKYVEWFMPRAAEFKRVLKRDGSFVLNIKEKTYDGERHTYVIDLILEMRKAGWLWTEEYVWHKKNCYPGKWPNRFRDAWERVA